GRAGLSVSGPSCPGRPVTFESTAPSCHAVRPTTTERGAMPATGHRSRLRRVLLHLWCLALTGAVFWPFLVTVGRTGDTTALLLRDMSVPPTMALNDLATGQDGLPRALPQDAILAWLSPVIPPPLLVAVLMLV